MSSLDKMIGNAFSSTSFGKSKKEAINELRSKFGHLDEEDIRLMLMPYVARAYDVPLSTSQAARNFGAPCLDNTHIRYEVARKMLRYLTLKIKL
jgi:hypothetical protein